MLVYRVETGPGPGQLANAASGRTIGPVAPVAPSFCVCLFDNGYLLVFSLINLFKLIF